MGPRQAEAVGSDPPPHAAPPAGPGLALVLAVKEGLRGPLEALCGPGGIYAARSIRYFLVVLTAGLLWPMTFRWFGKLGGNT